MSTTRTINGATYHVSTNRHERPLYALSELPDTARAEFDYIEGDDALTPRLFNYRGSWYDTHEFEVASDNIIALGFDAMQSESYFSAVALSFFGHDGYQLDGVVVGYIHW